MQKKISNLNELQELIDNTSIEKCFVEFVLLNIAKAKKLDEFLSEIEKMKSTDTMSISMIKEKLS